MTEFAKPDDQSNAQPPMVTAASGGGAPHQHHAVENGMSNGHSNGSSDGHKQHSKSSSSGHKSSSKDKDRHHHRDKDHHRSSSSSHKGSSGSSSSSKHKSSHRDKSSSSSSHQHHSSSSSSNKDKDRSSSHKSSSHDKERDKDKERSSGGGGGDKKDKDRSSSHHHKSGESRSKSSSSSSKSHHHKSSSKDKSHSSSSSKKREHRDKEERKEGKGDRDRHSSSRSEKKAEPVATNGHAVEESFNGNTSMTMNMNMDAVAALESSQYNAIVKMERMDVSQASSCDYSMSQFKDDEPSFACKEEPAQSDGDNDEEDDDDDDEEEDIPLFKRKKLDESVVKQEVKQERMDNDYEEDGNGDDDEDEDVPLKSRKKTSVKTEKSAKKKKYAEMDDSEEEHQPKKKKKVKKERTATKEEASPTKAEGGGGRKKKAAEEETEVWKWWEEDKRDDGVKWTFLEHKGPVFAPPYERLPSNVRFEYDGRDMVLSQDAEEIATFYARMLDHEYTTKKVFNDNFFKDWRKSMTSKEREVIKDLSKCNFRHMHMHFQKISEANKSRTKEQKQKLKEEAEQLVKEYGFCTIDGHKEKIGNFRIEPPGLFRGRGEHPKMGMVKRRVTASDITLNCSRDSVIPKAPPGERWKALRHDNSVTWLASWVENVQGQGKYIMLNPSSKLKGEKDWQKYETARRLDKQIDKIRSTYRDEWKSKEMRIRQRAVALYFIDILALRAGNEKDEDQADTVGCCSLRVEHIELHRERNGKENVVVFDFLGKDSIRYYNEVEVEKRVFKNLELFRENKKDGDDLFDRLNTVVLNEHLRDLMEGLTAKVFRTYNASITLQRQLDELTEPGATVPEKLLQYNRANRAVAILCNHQRAVPKTHTKSMENLKEKIKLKRQQITDCELEFKDLQKAAKRGSTKDKLAFDKKRVQLGKLKEQLQKLEIQETDKDENKTIALGTSKLNYLDPRISVAWCKKFGVPIEKIFNKTQRDKFRWAIDMAGPEYRF